MPAKPEGFHNAELNVSALQHGSVLLSYYSKISKNNLSRKQERSYTNDEEEHYVRRCHCGSEHSGRGNQWHR